MRVVRSSTVRVAMTLMVTSSVGSGSKSSVRCAPPSAWVSQRYASASGDQSAEVRPFRG